MKYIRFHDDTVALSIDNVLKRHPSVMSLNVGSIIIIITNFDSTIFHKIIIVRLYVTKERFESQI